jgi:hypothetical protein
VSSLAERTGKFDWYEFRFSSDGDAFTLKYDGSGICERGGDRLPFQLELPKGDTIHSLSYLRIDGDLVLVYLIGNGVSGSGRISRLDGSMLVTKWHAWIGGFNLGEAVAKGGFLYLSAICLVAKLDLQTGEYVWKQENLDQRFPGIFNSFLRPIIKKQQVFFTETTGLPITIVVDDVTGEIVSPDSKPNQ